MNKKKQLIEKWLESPVFLDDEERELYESTERGEWESVPDLKKALKSAQANARYTLAKSKSISIRLTPSDLDAIKVKAVEEGVPYQTLISSIIHKYAHDKFKNAAV